MFAFDPPPPIWKHFRTTCTYSFSGLFSVIYKITSSEILWYKKFTKWQCTFPTTRTITVSVTAAGDAGDVPGLPSHRLHRPAAWTHHKDIQGNNRTFGYSIIFFLNTKSNENHSKEYCIFLSFAQWYITYIYILHYK